MSNTPKFLLDENIPKLLRKFLETGGYSAEYAPKGIRNSELAYLALDKKLVLLSRDKDFLNSVLFPPIQFSGIIVLLMHPPKIERLIKGLEPLLADAKEFRGKLFIVREEGFEEISEPV